MNDSAIDIGAVIAVVFWCAIVAAAAWDEARRERRRRPDDGVDQLAEQRARELAGRDA